MFIVNILALLLTIAGAVNTGLVGLFNYNFFNMIFGGSVEGSYKLLTRILFTIIGLAGLWSFTFFTKAALFRNIPKNKN